LFRFCLSLFFFLCLSGLDVNEPHRDFHVCPTWGRRPQVGHRFVFSGDLEKNPIPNLVASEIDLHGRGENSLRRREIGRRSRSLPRYYRRTRRLRAGRRGRRGTPAVGAGLALGAIS
jgi:hypothetical protein